MSLSCIYLLVFGLTLAVAAFLGSHLWSKWPPYPPWMRTKEDDPVTQRSIYDSLLDTWVVRHQELLSGIVVGILTLALGVDGFMVEVLNLQSISWQTWTAEALHPTISGFIILAGVGICWLVRREWMLVMWIAAIVIGHLGLHF